LVLPCCRSNGNSFRRCCEWKMSRLLRIATEFDIAFCEIRWDQSLTVNVGPLNMGRTEKAKVGSFYGHRIEIRQKFGQSAALAR
jgi:hypothetical protein